MKVLGIITARGGSKGLPGKNVKNFAGKPLIAWTVEAAMKSALLNDFIVSTDSTEITKVALSYGAKVPFVRPSYLAQDDSCHVDTVLHSIDFMSQSGLNFNYVLLLQPTSPLRTNEDIDSIIDYLILNKDIKSIVSVSEVAVHSNKLYRINKINELEKFDSNSCAGLPRQVLTKEYYEDGFLYLIEVNTLRKMRTFIPPNTLPFFTPKHKSVDIDTICDFHYAEYLKTTCE